MRGIQKDNLDRAIASNEHLARSKNSATNIVRPAPILTVVIPTFNEADNVPIIAERVGAALKGTDWELLFVDDDSPDETSAVAKKLGILDCNVAAGDDQLSPFLTK